MSAHEAGFETASAALDEIFEHYGPLDCLDVDSFIDSQFKHALRGEEEISPLSHSETVIAKSKMVQIEDEHATGATSNSLEFSFGSDTQVNLDHTISLSPHQEVESSRLICFRCRENMDQEGLQSCCELGSKTTGTHDTEQTKGCAGGTELKGTQYILTTVFVFVRV